VIYYDKFPFRNAYCLGFIPLTFCGPPVIFVSRPICFSYDLTWLFGAQLRYAPCSCFQIIGSGAPCYSICSLPLSSGHPFPLVPFMPQLKNAVQKYQTLHRIKQSECAIFEDVPDSVLLSFGHSTRM
jgi:hypothetical protein